MHCVGWEGNTTCAVKRTWNHERWCSTHARAFGYASAIGMQTMFASWVISTPLGLMHEIIHGIILHRCMPFPPFAYLVSKPRNNAHETLVFGLTNDAQSLMQILYKTHLFLGLTCVIQALAKHSLKHTCLANILANCYAALHKPFACLRSLVPHQAR